MATLRVSPETYLLAAEYWHPDVHGSWRDSVLLDAVTATFVGAKLDAAFDALDGAEQDVRCWYYLLCAAEAAA